MLTKKFCDEAKSRWEDSTSDFNSIKKYVNSFSAFNFSQEDCLWLKKHNNNNRFVTYVGIDEYDQLILILSPLDEQGKEIELDEYLAVPFKKLESNITLIERDVVTTTKTAVLSTNLNLIEYNVSTDEPVFNAPSLTEKVSLDDIQLWNTEYYDWLYYESTHYKGKRIFRKFSVPFYDMDLDSKHNWIRVVFGLKYSQVFERIIPILVFIEDNVNNDEAKILSDTKGPLDPGPLDPTGTIMGDWSRPCPPMCAE